jgi:hypothetical protein
MSIFPVDVPHHGVIGHHVHFNCGPIAFVKSGPARQRSGQKSQAPNIPRYMSTRPKLVPQDARMVRSKVRLQRQAGIIQKTRPASVISNTPAERRKMAKPRPFRMVC